MEQLKLIIDIVSPILVAIITAILTHANVISKNNKAIDLEQYQKIFAPIHKILNFGKVKVTKYTYYEIESIINKNYSLIPENMLTSFNKLTVENFIDGDKQFNNFKNEIDTCYKYLSCTLGYARKKISRNDKKQAKKVINSESFDYNLTKILTKFLIGSILLSIYINLFIEHKDTIQLISSFLNVTLVLFSILSVGYTIFSLISTAISSHKTKKE